MWVKICGIRDVETAAAVVQAAPDAIGLNFYERSKRYVSPSSAAKIVASLPATVTSIGLFVNHSTAHIRRTCGDCGIRTIQLHGDETADQIEELADFEIIRALRVDAGNVQEITRTLAEYAARKIELLGCLVDAKIDGAYGGTGHQAPWELLAAHWQCDWPPLILAGGLTPQNVAQAIALTRPWGVDVASGVESAPGRQDPAAVRKFIAEARGNSHIDSNCRRD